MPDSQHESAKAGAALSPRALVALAVAAVSILALAIAMPFVLKDNQLAQTLFGILVAVATTLVSIYFTHRYSRSQAQSEQTRYGLQAWRNLDSLAIKVSKQIGGGEVRDDTLDEWLLDLDQAKWAWRDLLRRVFELQARLERETDEVSIKYKSQIALAHNPEAVSQLESLQRLELARLESQAPLPIRFPIEVACPRCATIVTARLGKGPGESAWPTCTNCLLRFPIHRDAGGSHKYGGQWGRTELDLECPSCHQPNRFNVPQDERISFEQRCVSCRTHISFEGTAEQHMLRDLGKLNAEFDCPHCHQESKLWISPGRRVSFLGSCEHCHGRVQVNGSLDNFDVKIPGANPSRESEA